MAFLTLEGIFGNCGAGFSGVVELVFSDSRAAVSGNKKATRCGWLTGYSNVVEQFLDCEDYIYSVFLCALCGKRLCFFR
jgi:hypothetical protein